MCYFNLRSSLFFLLGVAYISSCFTNFSRLSPIRVRVVLRRCLPTVPPVSFLVASLETAVSASLKETFAFILCLVCFFRLYNSPAADV